MCRIRWSYWTTGFDAAQSHQHVVLVTIVHVRARCSRVQCAISWVCTTAVVALSTDVIECGCRRGRLTRADWRGHVIERLVAKLNFITSVGQVACVLVRIVASNAVGGMRNRIQGAFADFNDYGVVDVGDINAAFIQLGSEQSAVAGAASTALSVGRWVCNQVLYWVHDDLAVLREVPLVIDWTVALGANDRRSQFWTVEDVGAGWVGGVLASRPVASLTIHAFISVLCVFPVLVHGHISACARSAVTSSRNTTFGTDVRRSRLVCTQ